MNKKKNKCDHKEYKYGEGFCCEEQYKKVSLAVLEEIDPELALRIKEARKVH